MTCFSQFSSALLETDPDWWSFPDFTFWFWTIPDKEQSKNTDLFGSYSMKRSHNDRNIRINTNRPKATHVHLCDTLKPRLQWIIFVQLLQYPPKKQQTKKPIDERPLTYMHLPFWIIKQRMSETRDNGSQHVQVTYRMNILVTVEWKHAQFVWT